MKKVYFFTLIFVLGTFFSVYAQDANNKNALGFKVLALDYQSQNGGSFGAINDYDNGFEIF